jgi:hypothetical protein
VPYLRWLGTALFGVEAARVVSDVFFLPVDTWAPVAIVDAIVFYANRFLCEADLFFGYAGSAAVALVIGYKSPEPYRGICWLIAALAPFAYGWWKRLFDLRLQGYLLWATGLMGVAIQLGKLPLSLAAAVSYGLALSVLWSEETRFGAQERSVMRNLSSIASMAAVATLLWRVVDPNWLGLAWIAAGVVALEIGILAVPSEAKWCGLAAAALGAVRMMSYDFPILDHHWFFPAAGGALLYWIAFRSRVVHEALLIPASWLGTGFAAVAIWAAASTQTCGAFWALYAAVLLGAGLQWNQVQLRVQGAALAFCAYFALLWLILTHSGQTLENPLLVACGFAIACFYGAQLLIPRDNLLRLYHSLLATTLTALVLYEQISGRMLTIAWGIQGVALLSAGFPLRDRVLRLSGLIILLACILKLFVYDLSYLDTLPRIFSFLVLGMLLVAVSWVYTRFREKVAKYL